jgi:hypothetical protein
MMHNPPIQFVIGLFRNLRPYEKRELERKGSCKRLLIGKNPALWGTLKCQDSALQMSFSVKWDTRRSDHISQLLLLFCESSIAPTKMYVL